VKKKKNGFSALNKSEIMKPNESKFNKRDLKIKFAIYVRQPLCFLAPGVKKPCFVTAYPFGFSD